nr:ribonuclease H-like domain-containing protein [Tanacetum cinerariifolium]
MQEELLQFKIQNVWSLVDCPKGVRTIRTKWVLKNKKDKRGIVIRNKARLVAQVHTQEEGIDYDEVFALVARIKAIRLFLAYASFMRFIVYQMDVKSAFLYGATICIAWGRQLMNYILCLLCMKKGLPKKATTPQVLAIHGCRIQKPNKKPQAAKGKGKGKGKGKIKIVYAPKPNNPKPAAKEHPEKDDACHHCKERERDEDEPRLLDTTIGRTVPLLPIAPDHAESELEASVNRLFNEGGSGHQTEHGDSKEGRQDVNLQPVAEAVDTIVEDAAPMLLKRQGKRKFLVVDGGEASHPSKKLREDHGNLSGGSVGGKSRSSLQRLLAEVVLNVEVGVVAIPTLPFIVTPPN